MPVPPRVRRINIEATLQGGELMVHSLHCQYQDPNGPIGGAPNLEQQADFVAQEWIASMLDFTPHPWRGQIATSTVYQRVVVYELNAGGLATDSAETLFSPVQAGTSSGIAPTSLAMCCSLKTSKPGRSFRGRLYLGGLGSVTFGTTNGRTSTGARDKAANALADFISTLNGQGANPTGEAAVSVGVLSVAKTLITPITQVVVDDVFDWQSRRQDALVGTRALVNVTNL